MSTVVKFGPEIALPVNSALGRKHNPRILTFVKFARSFANYLRLDFDKLYTDHFAPDSYVIDYMEDGLDWLDLADALEEEFGIKTMDTTEWEALAGFPGLNKPVCQRLTLNDVFMFVRSKQLERQRKNRRIDALELRTQVRDVIANNLPFFDSGYYLPDAYKIPSSYAVRFYILEDLVSMARRCNFSFNYSNLEDLLERPNVVVDDVFRFLQESAEFCYKMKARRKSLSLRLELKQLSDPYCIDFDGIKIINPDPLQVSWFGVDFDGLASTMNFDYDIDKFFQVCESGTTQQDLIDEVIEWYTEEIS